MFWSLLVQWNGAIGILPYTPTPAVIDILSVGLPMRVVVQGDWGNTGEFPYQAKMKESVYVDL